MNISKINHQHPRPQWRGKLAVGVSCLLLASNALAQTLYYEDFESLTLGPSVDEGVRRDGVWTQTPPAGWTIDDTRMPGWDNPATDGVTEWSGWGFANKDWWALTAGGQQREQFALGSGNVMIADPDEWDDAAHARGLWDADASSGTITVNAPTANSLVLAFDSSWRPEAFDDPGASFPVDENGAAINNQTGIIRAAFNGAAPVEVLRWDSNNREGEDQYYHDHAPNESVLIPLNNPAGLTSLRLIFTMEKGANDWWWALDNITVGEPPLMVGLAATGVAFTARIAEGLGKTVNQGAGITVTLDGTQITPNSITPEGEVITVSYTQAPQVWRPRSTHEVKLRYTSNEGRVIEETRTFVAPSYTTATATPTSVTATITDPEWFTTSEGAGITMKVDGVSVTPSSVVRNGAQVLVTYSQAPNLYPAGSNRALEVTFKTTEGAEVVDTATVTIPDWKTIPAGLGTALGTGAQPGLLFKTHIIETNRPTTIASAEAQLRGELGPSIHDPSLEVNGRFEVDFINFEQAAGIAGNFNANAEGDLAVADWYIPGTGDGVYIDNIAGDIRAFVEIPAAGLYTMVVNSDDGFQLSTGTADSPNYLVLGQWNAGRGATDSVIYFQVTQPGVYFFRLLWFEGTGGASVEWLTVNANGTRALVNGTQPGALKAYRVRTVAEPPITTPGGIESYTYTGGSLVITYSGTLQSASALDGAFAPVAGATSPYTVPLTGDEAYYTAE